MQPDKSLAIIIAGGNGSGKSTLIQSDILPEYSEYATYINADDWQKETYKVLDNSTPEHAQSAQKWADQERKNHLESKKSFISETVFSHPSKIELLKEAKEKGFEVLLYHIGLNSPNTALDRIKERVMLGGHDVDADKVKGRYDRIPSILREATQYADKSFVFDNSVLDRPHLLILKLERGVVKNISNAIPDWVMNTYKDQINDYLKENPLEKLRVTLDSYKDQIGLKEQKAIHALHKGLEIAHKDQPDVLNHKLGILADKVKEIAEGKYTTSVDLTVNVTPDIDVSKSKQSDQDRSK